MTNENIQKIHIQSRNCELTDKTVNLICTHKGQGNTKSLAISCSIFQDFHPFMIPQDSPLIHLFWAAVGEKDNHKDFAPARLQIGGLKPQLARLTLLSWCYYCFCYFCCVFIVFCVLSSAWYVIRNIDNYHFEKNVQKGGEGRGRYGH